MNGATIVVNGAGVGDVLLEEKTFSSGKQGFWGQQKLQIDGKRYQAQVQIVEIKPKS